MLHSGIYGGFNRQLCGSVNVIAIEQTEELLTTVMAARRIGVSTERILQLVHAKILPAVKVLDGWRGLAIAYMGARYVFRREFRILR